MYLDAALAYLHYLAIFFFAWTLLRQWTLLRGGPPALDLDALAKTYTKFFLAAIVVLGSGVGRVFLGIKPAVFYQHNPIFHIKASLFVLIVILSIQPMLAVKRWRREQGVNVDYRVAPNDWRRIRSLLLIELHLLALIPLLAVLMARGIGSHD